MQRPDESELLLTERIRHVENIQDDQYDNRQSNVEHDYVHVPVGVLEVVDQVEEFNESLDALGDRFRVPDRVNLITTTKNMNNLGIVKVVYLRVEWEDEDLEELDDGDDKRHPDAHLFLFEKYKEHSKDGILDFRFKFLERTLLVVDGVLVIVRI